MDPYMVFCSSGHSMSELHVEGMNGDNFTYECSMCHQSIIQEKLPHSCDLCSYYLCTYCLSSVQSIQWTQQNHIKAQLISKAKPRKPKIPKMHFEKFLKTNSYSPVTLLSEMTKLYPKYWHKSTVFIVKIIEDAIFNKSIDAISYSEEKIIKTKKRNINYHKFRDKLVKYSCGNRWCSDLLLNILFMFGFRRNNNNNRLIWNKKMDQSHHPQMCLLYCQLKNIINENWKINDINNSNNFYNELMINPMPFIINRYCDIISNDNIYSDISTLIYEYAFREYTVMKCKETFPASFIRNLQFVQDPKQYNSVVMCIGNQRYLFINISQFERQNQCVMSTLSHNTYEGYND